MRKFLRFGIAVTLVIVLVPPAMNQRTQLDNFRSTYRTFRQMFFNFVGRTGNDPQYFAINQRNGKIQKQFSNSTPFFCDVNGPGKRSKTPPISVHQLRPGDIDIIAAMGDSLTAGNGAMSTNPLQIVVENKGISWSIGGQATWRKFLTIPNILKEFNPKLYGYSLRDGASIDRSSRFNVAELGAMSRDMPYQAKILLKRLQSDPNVNMTSHWKMITFLIGANDLCSDICYFQHPEKAIEAHERDLLQTLRFLRKNIPRLMVNLLVTPSMKILTDFKGKPPECVSSHVFECPCLFGQRFASQHQFLLKLNEEWKMREIEVANRDEFHNLDDFTVNLQTFTKNIVFPFRSNGLTDFRYMSTDCFHLSQKGYARAANAIWNNMIERDGEKTDNWEKEFKIFKCPTEDHPFIATKKNSRRKL